MAEHDIVVMGIGGAGCRLAGWLSSRGGRGPHTVVVDSDTCALAGAEAQVRLQVGEDLTNGFGAGGDPERGRLAVEGDLPRLLATMEGCRILFLLVGLGGGVGSGAAPAVAAAARAAGVMTVCFAVLPFGFEGSQKRAAAQRALDSLHAACDVAIAISNGDVFERVEGAELPELFDRANRVLGGCAYALWQLLAMPGYLRLDAADLKRMASDTEGVCELGYADASGEDRARQAVLALLDGPMLDRGRLLGKARLALALIVGGPDLRLKEIGEVMDLLAARLRPECRVVMGTAIDDAWVGRLTVCIIAGERRAVAPMPGTDAVPREPPFAGGAAGGMEPPAVEPATVKKGRGKDRQTVLPLDPLSGRGRFKDTEPTLLNGEDLDVPTFARRHMRIER